MSQGTSTELSVPVYLISVQPRDVLVNHDHDAPQGFQMQSSRGVSMFFPSMPSHDPNDFVQALMCAGRCTPVCGCPVFQWIAVFTCLRLIVVPTAQRVARLKTSYLSAA